MSDKKVNIQAGEYVDIMLNNPFQDSDSKPGEEELIYELYEQEITSNSLSLTATNDTTNSATTMTNSSNSIANAIKSS